MQVKVVSGSQLGFDALVYQQPDNKLLNYLQNSITTAGQQLGTAVGNKLNAAGNYFINMAQNAYNAYNSDLVINAGKALVNTMDTHINPDVILEYNENNMYLATPKMQQYIMAQPDMWELNNEQSCEAFGGTYFNVNEDVMTYKDHIRYMEVMDGVLQYDENGDGYIMSYTDIEFEDLHTYDKFSILSTWDAVSNMIAEGLDPSSLDGSEL